MKEDVMLALMQKNSVVTWNYLQDPLIMTKKEFLTLARINHYDTAEIAEGWLIAFQPSHNLESACASLGKEFIKLIK